MYTEQLFANLQTAVAQSQSAQGDVDLAVEVTLKPIVSCNFDKNEIAKLQAMSAEQRALHLNKVFADLAINWLNELLAASMLNELVSEVAVVN